MSSLRRSGRDKKPVDYKALGSKGRTRNSSFSSEDELVITKANSAEENELFGTQSSEEPMESEEEAEEGEITDDEQSSDDEDLAKLVDQLDTNKLKAVLRKRQEECVSLQKKLKKEKEKDEKRKKEAKELLALIKATDKKKANLKRSLDVSRSSTPAQSPKKEKIRKTTTKSDTRKVVKRKKVDTQQRKKEDPQETSEYKDTLNSLLKLKQGTGSVEYPELVEKAMEATDNIYSIKKQREIESSNKKDKKDRNNKVGQQSVIELLEQLNTNREGTRSHLDEPGAGASDPNKSASTHPDKSEMTHNETKGLLNELKNTKTPKEKIGEKLVNLILHNKGTADDLTELCNKFNETIKVDTTETTQESEVKAKKLTSGRCAKPDESDIKRVVKFAHERLDPRHTKDRNFDKLSLHMLIAGELELAGQNGISPEERNARINIAKTLCYHKNYLSDDILRDGYDQVLKRVERRQQDWNEVLGEHLHELLTYKANIIMREKMQEKDGPFTKVEGKKFSKPVERQQDNNSEKIIFCNDYNIGKCTFQDHHEGRFAGKRCTRFHICKKCYITGGEIKSHRENSEACPKSS